MAVARQEDVLALAGLFTLWLMSNEEGRPATVYALEPMDPNVSLLEENIAAAGVQEKVWHSM